LRGGAVGGFDERLFGAEDVAMAYALQRGGRFIVIWDSVVTSGRRMRGLAGFRMLWALGQLFRWCHDPRRDSEKTRSIEIRTRRMRSA
jgi:hypothetical protein